MPTHKYCNLSIKREVREELDKLREELKISDLNDLLILLVRTYREHTNTISKFEEILTNTVSKFEEALTNSISKMLKEVLEAHTNSISKDTSTASMAHTNSVSKETSSHTNTVSKTYVKQKKTAWDILVEQKITCASSIKPESRERILDYLKKTGAVIIKTDEDICAVLPEFWDEFKKKLSEIKTLDDKEVLSRLRNEKLKKIFSLLRKHGALYLDNKSREWVYDYSLSLIHI